VTPPDLPGFTFVQHLGSGGFADVLLYEQDWPRQRVAVKVVRPGIAMSPKEKALFRSEADSMARLADHPYIVSVLTAGETADGLPYLVMRYCPPPDLGARVRATPLSVADALATGVKLASAVETAHRSGILHRDIKPSNVLITTYNEPALTDFGIAGRIHEEEPEGEVRMSYPWAPPELIDGRSRGTVASDVYSLGATIWNLLVGWSPFVLPHGDNSDHALATRILHTPPSRTGRADVPEALDHLLIQCLAKEGAHRPATALEVARALQRIEAGLGFARTPVAVEDSRSYAGHHRDTNPDATRVKPMGVVHAQTTGSGARAHTPTDSRAAGRPPGEDEHRSHGTVLWSVLGILAALGLGAALLLGGGGDDDPEPDPTSSTPDPVLPQDPLPVPEAEGRIAGDRAVFTWTQPGQQPGDRWLWETPGREGRQSVSRRRVSLPAGDDGPCITVALLRDGQTSQPTSVCPR